MLPAFLLTVCLALGITFGNLGMNKHHLELCFCACKGRMLILLRQTFSLLLHTKSSLDHLN